MEHPAGQTGLYMGQLNAIFIGKLMGRVDHAQNGVFHFIHKDTSFDKLLPYYHVFLQLTSPLGHQMDACGIEWLGAAHNA